jgi:hypothetical protein
MKIIEVGIVNDENDEHSGKHEFSIKVIEVGIVKNENDEHIE